MHAARKPENNLSSAGLGQKGSNVTMENAITAVLTDLNRQRIGIGMQMEKSTHAILKNYKDPEPSHQEVPVGNYIADLCDPAAHTITEIQTANFGAMKDKLNAFLKDYKVTIVHPIPHRKTVCWIDPSTGEVCAENPSHFIGSFYEVFRELAKIETFLTDPNLVIEPLLLDLKEYRMQDGWGNNGKRGSHRFDRIPSGIYDDLVLAKPEDYTVFLPQGDLAKALPDPFTTKDLERVVGIHRKSLQYSSVLRVLTTMGVTERVGMTGSRAYQYRIRIPNETGRDFCRSRTRRLTGQSLIQQVSQGE